MGVLYLSKILLPDPMRGYIVLLKKLLSVALTRSNRQVFVMNI
jgi:hypothetical protein